MKRLIIITSALGLFLGTAQLYGSTLQDEAYQTIFTKESIKTVKIKITGMTCAGCSNHVTQALQDVDGVKKVSLEYPGDTATISFDSSLTNEQALVKAIEKVNYKAVIIKEDK